MAPWCATPSPAPREDVALPPDVTAKGGGGRWACNRPLVRHSKPRHSPPHGRDRRKENRVSQYQGRHPARRRCGRRRRHARAQQSSHPDATAEARGYAGAAVAAVAAVSGRLHRPPKNRGRPRDRAQARPAQPGVAHWIRTAGMAHTVT